VAEDEALELRMALREHRAARPRVVRVDAIEERGAALDVDRLVLELARLEIAEAAFRARSGRRLDLP
jgi:hypothetical protein